MRLAYKFYNRHAAVVARNLLGKKFVFGNQQGIITETEAYRGNDDEASHAYKGMTNRNAIMFGSPGFAYVYIIYGIYYCFNIVTEEAGQASAVLIRGLKLPNIHLDGPGKICRYFGITTEASGINLIESKDCYLKEGANIKDIFVTPRIGITKAVNKPWRFIANINEIF